MNNTQILYIYGQSLATKLVFFFFFYKLQNWLQPKVTILLNKINITSYFENLIVELHVF